MIRYMVQCLELPVAKNPLLYDERKHAQLNADWLNKNNIHKYVVYVVKLEIGVCELDTSNETSCGDNADSCCELCTFYDTKGA